MQAEMQVHLCKGVMSYNLWYYCTDSNHCHNIQCTLFAILKRWNIFIVDLQYPHQHVPIPIICERHRLIGGIFI